ncbi:hypothetical protein SLS60_006948 [Paraconiothyrium brasiliense]|uniref:Uncharacterized protein n=1 Tax=Paraconiothyrium brasiliense TaxID=300254 RepID=A0ABR3R895_9PLEO
MSQDHLHPLAENYPNYCDASQFDYPFGQDTIVLHNPMLLRAGAREELKVQVLAFNLVWSSPISEPDKSPKQDDSLLHYLRTTPDIAALAKEVYYSLNTFRVGGPDSDDYPPTDEWYYMNDFREQIDPVSYPPDLAHPYIRRLVFEVFMMNEHQTSSLLKLANTLKLGYPPNVFEKLQHIHVVFRYIPGMATNESDAVMLDFILHCFNAPNDERRGFEVQGIPLIQFPFAGRLDVYKNTSDRAELTEKQQKVQVYLSEMIKFQEARH